MGASRAGNLYGLVAQLGNTDSMGVALNALLTINKNLGYDPTGNQWGRMRVDSDFNQRVNNWARNASTLTIATNDDISGGVTQALENYSAYSLYLTTAGAVDVTVELSPDSESNYMEPSESPIVFNAAGDEIIEIAHPATHIRLTGSNATQVTAVVRGNF
jgi:hypothetical protein